MVKLPRWEEWTADFIIRAGEHCINVTNGIKTATEWSTLLENTAPLEDVATWSTLIHLLAEVHVDANIRIIARDTRAKISDKTANKSHELFTAMRSSRGLDKEALAIVARTPEFTKTQRGVELEQKIGEIERDFLAECASVDSLDITIKIMQTSPDESARKDAFDKYINRSAANRNKLPAIIQLRLELAKEYGYASYRDFVWAQTPHRMIKDPVGFIAEIKPGLIAAAKKEARELFNSDTIPYWNWKYSIRTQPGGSFERALADYAREFGVKFSVIRTSVWAPDVVCYQMILRDGRKSIVYFDLYPREGKFNHAATYLLRPPTVSRGVTYIGIQVVLCSFSREWCFDNTVTFYHELGHVMHHAHMKVNMRENCNVEMDFVEVPSRLMERYINPQPADWAIAELRQLALAEYDFEIHGSNPPKNAEECAALMRKVFGATPLEGDVGNFYASFAHYIEIYPCYYYCYVTAAIWGDRLFRAIRNKKYADLIDIFEPAAMQSSLEALEKFISVSSIK